MTTTDSANRAKEALQVINTLRDASRGALQQPDAVRIIDALRTLYEKMGYNSLAPLASLLLRLEGEPYSLSGTHYPMLPLFDLRVPRRSIIMSGRQISKSMSNAARILLRGAVLPFHHRLIVAPRYDQIRRFSTNYVDSFLKSSAFSGLLMRQEVKQSVMQKWMKNGTILHFAFALLTVDRVRGISARELDVDEAQDLDFDFLPILRETMSASKHGSIESYYGTPLTFDNTMAQLWSSSSQAEWHTPCSCGHVNVPTIAEGVMKMIQIKGFCCAKCSAQLNPRQGRWHHHLPEHRRTFVGRHIPQVIMPMHWERPHKWQELIDKRGSYPPAKFANEVLGESCDVGQRLITLEDLKRACCLPFTNTIENAIRHRGQYMKTALGIDWGGHGKEEVSYTAVSYLGLTAGGVVDCLYMERLHLSMREDLETARIMELYKILDPMHVGHDFNGSGALREIMLLNGGLDPNRVMPIIWVRAAPKKIVQFVAPPERQIFGIAQPGGRHYYSVDKSRIFALCMASIRTGKLRFPQYESCQAELSDWMALYEEKQETKGAADLYLIRRATGKPDDVAQSTAFGCTVLWHTTELPDLAPAAKYGGLDEMQQNLYEPPSPDFSRPPGMEYDPFH